MPLLKGFWFSWISVGTKQAGHPRGVARLFTSLTTPRSVGGNRESFAYFKADYGALLRPPPLVVSGRAGPLW
jgi:hypothetical protein